MKASPKTLKQEIGFSDHSPEYQACIKFLEAISPKSKSRMQEKSETIDLISPENSPEKETTAVPSIEKTGGNDKTVNKKNDETNEEHEDDNNNKEDKKDDTKQARNEQ